MTRSTPDLSTLMAALDAASCAVVIADARKPDLPLVYVNRTFEKITGYSPAESLGRNCRFLQGPDRSQPGLQAVRKAIRAGRACTVILKNHRKDGTPFQNELSLAPVRGASGRLTHYIGVQTDVTARITAEEALIRQRRTLEDTVSMRTEELARKNAALTEVLGQLEVEKKSLRQNLIENVDRLALPLLSRLEKTSEAGSRKALRALRATLEELTSPFGRALTRPMYRLSPREIEVCGLIKNGLGTKEISALFKTSSATVENQRLSIRKKLGISRERINLAVFLRDLR